MAELEQERLQIQAGGEVLVSAPVDGLVASRLIERGQSVVAGQPLLSLLPSGSELQAHLLVPSRAVGFVEPGDPVMLRYQAFPHQKFGHHPGTVIRISRNSLTPQSGSAFSGTGAPREPFYRVMVQLSEQTIMAYGKPEALLPGMLVEADILGEKRKLYEWLLEPLYSLSGKL
jgi:membrane fusion protein